MTKKKTDPHILELKEYCIRTADMIRDVIGPKPHVTDEMRERYDADRPEFDGIVNKSSYWPGQLSFIKRRLDDALMKATQIDIKPSIPMANAYYPGQVTKVLRMIIEAEYVKDADKTLRRLEWDDIRAICNNADCAKPLLWQKSKNAIMDDGKVRQLEDCCQCDRGEKARAMELERSREMQKKSDKKAARRKAKENRGKPDPEYVKAMEKRKKELREKEGVLSREERRKQRGF